MTTSVMLSYPVARSVFPANPYCHGLVMAHEVSRRPSYRVRNGTVNDYAKVIASVDNWWSGRNVSVMLPRLFFEHFCDTTFVVEVSDHAPDGTGQVSTPSTPTVDSAAGDDTPALSQSQEEEKQVVGFLCGFVSQAKAGEVSVPIPSSGR